MGYIPGDPAICSIDWANSHFRKLFVQGIFRQQSLHVTRFRLAGEVNIPGSKNIPK
jgi:hypothetical protein